MYSNGEILPRDYIEALAWLLTSKRHGMARSDAAIEALKLRLTPSEIEQARQRSERQVASFER
jgi:hypothetical protein